MTLSSGSAYVEEEEDARWRGPAQHSSTGSKERTATNSHVLEKPSCDGMARLVVGHRPLLLQRHDRVALLHAAYDAVHGGLEVLHRDGVALVARGMDRSLVADVRNVGADKARRKTACDSRGCQPGTSLGVPQNPRPAAHSRGHALRILLAVARDLDRREVDEEDLLATLDVGLLDLDLAVEAAGAQDGLVEDVRTVGAGEDDDAVGRRETIHLDEELVCRRRRVCVGGETSVDVRRCTQNRPPAEIAH